MQITAGCLFGKKSRRGLESTTNQDLFPLVSFATKLPSKRRPNCPSSLDEMWLTMQYHEPQGGPANTENAYWVSPEKLLSREGSRVSNPFGPQSISLVVDKSVSLRLCD
jgi:hypothetical protein